MPEATRVDVAVLVSGGTTTFDPPAPDVAILAGNATGTANYAVVFSLSGGNWLEQPIAWLHETPPGLQPGFTIPPLASNQRAVGISNDLTSTDPPKTFLFTVNHDTPGAIMITDPDIVLDPPSP